jgi:hypothetical protein
MSTEEKLAAWAGGLELRAKFLSEADEDDWREEAGASVSVMNGAAAELRRLSAEVQKLREALEYIEGYADERVEHHSRRGETELRLAFQDVGLKAKAALAPETKERS